MAPAHPAQGRAPGHANAPEVGNSDRQVVRKIFQRAVLDVAGNGRGHELLHRVRRGQVVRTTPNSALIFPSFHVSDRFLLTGERVAGEAVEYVEPAKVSGLVHPRLCVSAYDLAADEAHSFFSFTMRSGGGGTLSASMPRSCKNIATSSMVRYSTFSCPSSSSSGRTPTLPSSRSQTAMIAAKMPCPSFFSRPFSSCSSAPMVACSIKFFTTRWSLVRSTPFLSFSVSLSWLMSSTVRSLRICPLAPMPPFPLWPGLNDVDFGTRTTAISICLTLLMSHVSKITICSLGYKYPNLRQGGGQAGRSGLGLPAP